MEKYEQLVLPLDFGAEPVDVQDKSAEPSVLLFGVKLTHEQFMGFNLLYCAAGAMHWDPMGLEFDTDYPHLNMLKAYDIDAALMHKFVMAGYFDYADGWGNYVATDKLKRARNDYMRAYYQVYPNSKGG